MTKVVDFIAWRDPEDDNYMIFEIESKPISEVSKMHMEDVLTLYKYLQEEIEDWLNN